MRLPNRMFSFHCSGFARHANGARAHHCQNLLLMESSSCWDAPTPFADILHTLNHQRPSAFHHASDCRLRYGHLVAVLHKALHRTAAGSVRLLLQLLSSCPWVSALLVSGADFHPSSLQTRRIIWESVETILNAQMWTAVSSRTHTAPSTASRCSGSHPVCLWLV